MNILSRTWSTESNKRLRPWKQKWNGKEPLDSDHKKS